MSRPARAQSNLLDNRKRLFLTKRRLGSCRSLATSRAWTVNASIRAFLSAKSEAETSAFPRVLFTPHIGFNSVEAVERILQTTVDNIRAYISGAPINTVAL